MKQDLADKFNIMIDNAIIELIDDNPRKGAEALVEIAKVWAAAGLPQDSFMNVRQYIINEAIERTDAAFIQDKLEASEKLLREQRTKTTIILN